MEKLIIAAVAVGLVLFGGIFKAVSFYVGKTMRKRKENCTAQAIATITDIETERRRLSSGEYHTFYHPIYEYYANGEMIRVRSYMGLARNQVHAGQTVRLFYNTFNPQEYYCEAENANYLCLIFNIVAFSVWAAALLLVVIDLFVL